MPTNDEPRDARTGRSTIRGRARQERLNASIQQLYTDAQKGERFNLMPSIVEAVEAYATSGEVIGTIRKARGLNYDPFNMIECPFALH